jgi:hypothetical protein
LLDAPATPEAPATPVAVTGQLEAFALHTQVPLLHSVPGMQTLPQSPQFFESVSGSAHTVPQTFLPVAQTQDPSVQVRVESQALPQVPQLATSVFRLAHLLPHFVSTLVHFEVQTPWLHTCVGSQAGVPVSLQAPQCVRSVIKSTHLVPHKVVFLAGLQMQTPSEQTLSAAQIRPH